MKEREIKKGDRILVPCNKINGTPYYIYADVLEKEEDVLKVATEFGEYEFQENEVVTYQKTPVWEPVIKRYGDY